MDEKMMILKMLQEGKITAEEAHKLLEAINQNQEVFEDDIRKNEKKLEEKLQELQQKANKIAEKVSSKLNNSAEKFSTNSEKFGDDFAKRMEGFGNDIADSAVKFTDRIINYIGNYIDIGNDKYQYNKSFVFQIAENSNIYVDSDNFTVILNSIEGEELLVNSYINTSTADMIIEDYMKFEQTNSGINIKTRFPNKTWGKIEIMIPRNLSTLNIATTNGRCELNNITANSIESNTSNGKISLVDCRSKNIKAITSNGKIVSVDTTAEYAYYSTSNGKIEIENCKFDKLDTQTSNGSIVLDGINKINSAEANYSLKTSNGKIIIELNNGNDLGCMIDASTSIGNITVDLPQLKYFIDKKNLNMQSTAQIKSSNFDNVNDKIFINAHTSNSSIMINENK